MVRGFILPIVIRLVRQRSNSLRFLYAKLSNGYRVMDRWAWTAYVKYVYHNLLITYRSIAKVELLQDCSVFLNFPLQAIAAKTISSIVEVSLQIFRATGWSINSHQTFTRHQLIILSCDDTKTTKSNLQTFCSATKHYIVWYKERLLRKLALSCSISLTKVLLCLENFIPPATLRSHPRKYRNERVGGSLRPQWTRVPRVRESLRATTSRDLRAPRRRMQTPSIAGACLLGWKKGQEDPNRRRDKQLPSFLLIFYPLSVLRSIAPLPRKLSRFFLVGGRIRLLLLAGWVSVWLTYCRAPKEESSFHSLSCSFARENNRCRFSTTRS